MKSFIRGILTIWITLLLFVLGIVCSMKSLIVDFTEGIVKEELKTHVVDVVENLNDANISADVIEKIENEIENNQDIKKLINKYYDKVMDILNDEEYAEIDVATELESLIDDSEKILKDYGITITDKEKQELLSVVESSDINTSINESINEVKTNLSSEVKTLFDIYSFVTSTTFKVILVGLIVVALLFLALLYKNLYDWLLNFGYSSIMIGILTGIMIPMVMENVISDLLSKSNITLATTSLNIYGYILIVLGVISIVTKKVITKIVNKKQAIAE